MSLSGRIAVSVSFYRELHVLIIINSVVQFIPDIDRLFNTV